jgi:molecular chaperone IbpA|tara:strand:- start:2608 stop:3054 length:447 start_codon:yes stop_codon:yes gene_type:complete
MTRLTTLDLPTFTRSTVGFDQLFNELTRDFANTKSNGYPPYNVAELNDDEWMISLAVAGFGMDNLDITLDKNTLTIEGSAPGGDEDVKYLHKGIGGRNFRRAFTLAEHVEVEGAELKNGVLNIHLVRNVPEALQPKKINIRSVDAIEG